MKSVFILLDSLFQLYLWVVIINAVLSWLVAFNIINTSNRFVYRLIELSYNLTEPLLRKIRNVVPIIAGIDFSPVILILLLIFLRNLLFEFFAPNLF
ncbi:MAG: YggT family protein [Proteobacteria bacterium]|jgi:YggT family protein|nr:YggT family protein [Pseudomonadota bacterium]MDC0375480.1 YggT family protein [Pelagibacteraceae bacterium]NCV24032.1 YggT family protein [Pseudomonadota bacterium]NCW79672.1 YggT family protein [Pelagibacteraceae bacterium]